MDQDQMGEMPEEEGEEEIPSEDVGQDQLMANLEKLNSLVADLTTEIESAKDEAGMGEEEELGGEEGLPPEEEEFGEEAPEEGMEEEVPDEEGNGEEDTPFPPKKKKKKSFPPKEM